MAIKTKIVGRLAIEGGKKVWNRGFPAWPQFDRKTDAKAFDILRSGKVNYWGGHFGMDFEKSWTKWLGVKNAMVVSNGIAALHVALTALGIGSGDEVIFSSEPPLGLSLCGALPVSVDMGLGLSPDPKKIEKRVTRRTKAIVVSHSCGMVADLDPIMDIAKRHGLYVIEDCSECVGGMYKGKKAGSVGTISCFSFGASSHFSAGGEGGMVCCDNDDLAREVRSVRDHGYDVREKLDLLKMEGRQSYVHRRVGYNFRMTELQAAIGLGELERFDKWNLPRRRRFGRALVRGLAGHPLVTCAPIDTKDRRNSFLMAPFVLEPSKLRCTMKGFVEAVCAEGACACAVLQSSTAMAFWAHPVYTLAHAKADVRAFKKVAMAMMQ